MMRTLLRSAILLVAASVFPSAIQSIAQEQAPQVPAKPTFVSPSQRLANAKTVYVKNGGGTSIPFDVISGAFDGWARFVPVGSPEKADLIVEVTSPEDTKATTTGKGGISASGMPEQTMTTTREVGSDRVKMVVQDAKSHITLWAASQQAKSAMKQRSYNDNLVDAAQKLFTQFHDRVEPPAAK
jgi:hypothetical protein